MKRLARLAAIMFLGTACLSHAAIPYAFPDQPGALSAEEIQAATDAMKPMLGTGPALPLVASGKRSPGHMMPAYALFAAPLVDFSDRVKSRRQVVCNYFSPMSRWQCSTPHDEMRMSANGLEHVFSYQVIQGSGDSQTAVDVADFMYSRCFGAQYAAIGGKPFTPSPDSDFVNTVLDDGKGFTVITGPLGDGASYRLEKTDKSVDNCGFRIHHVRMAKSGVILPESYAKEVAKEVAKEAERARVEAERARVEAREKEFARTHVTLGLWTIEREHLAAFTMWGAMICGGLALVVPWFLLVLSLLLGLSRWTAAGAAGVLALVGTIMAAVSATYMPGKYNIRIDLLINGVLMLIAWTEFVVLGFWATAGQAESSKGVRLALWMRLTLWTLLVTFVVFPLINYALMWKYAYDSPGESGQVLLTILFWPTYAAHWISGEPVVLISTLFQLTYSFVIVWIISLIAGRKAAVTKK